VSEPFNVEEAEGRARRISAGEIAGVCVLADDFLRLAQMWREVTKERDQLKRDLDGEVGFIGFRASSKVWEQQAKEAKAEILRLGNVFSTDDYRRVNDMATIARLTDERDALAAAMPSEGADAALAYAVEKSRAEKAEAALCEAKAMVQKLVSRLEESNPTCSEVYEARKVMHEAK